MSCYVNEVSAVAALKQMRKFYCDLESLYESHDLSVVEDLGRRNILMSSLQEKYFAAEIAKRFPGTHANGKTGEPDIIIPQLNRELECKLTSPNKSGSWQLQTDYNTLSRKGSVDHLYVLANGKFDKFAVLFFEKLTTDDFHSPSPGSKGKARLHWSHAWSKCTALVGEITDNSRRFLADATAIFEHPGSTSSEKLTARARIDYWSSRTNVSFGLEKV